MRAAILTVGLAALAALSIATTWLALPPARAEASTRAPAIVAAGIRAATVSTADGASRVELPWLWPGDADPAISPDGTRVAFSSARSGSTEIHVVEAGSGRLQQLTHNASSEDLGPAWSPDGSRLVWASGRAGAHDLFVMNEDGSGKRRLVAGLADDVDPAWSPDGSQIAYAANRGGRYGLWAVPAGGGEPTPLVEGPGQMRAPAWSPAGDALAYTGIVAGDADVWVVGLGGAVAVQATAAKGFDGRPDWSPDGSQLVFVSNRGGSQRLWLMLADGSRQRLLDRSDRGDDAPDWAVVEPAIGPTPGTLLPDLDQRAPSGLLVVADDGTIRLGFTSAVDNIGDGPIHIRGTRSGTARVMRADQIVHRSDGATAVVAAVGTLVYESHPPHLHWHLEPYEAYELRRADDSSLIGRDGKSGFCLLDRPEQTIRNSVVVAGPPVFVGDCAAGRPQARRVDEGSSVGYTDRYPGIFHGQDIDITGLAPGLYLLVHRANPERRIRELRYSNNEASALVRISKPEGSTGLPTGTIVRRCPTSDRCQAR